MGSVFIPVDKCTKENSCLQVLDGSYLMGRINHMAIGDQFGAEPERYNSQKPYYKEIVIFQKPILAY